QVAAVIVRGTRLKGQHGSGRVMMPWVPNTFTTPATSPELLNAAGIAAYTAFMNAVFGTSAPASVVAAGSTFNPAILSRPTPPSLLVTNGGIVQPAYTALDTRL